jgi:hypothetical protein
MKTIDKDKITVYENIIWLMDRFPGLASVLLTLIIFAGFIR